MFRNTYEDEAYARSYAGLEWSGTYFPVRRDLPEILRQHVTGRRALDFGCGTGRSTRLLRSYGFIVTGIDISPPMIQRARELDPDGDYVLTPAGDLSTLANANFDLILAAFPFDNIPAVEKTRLLRMLSQLLAAGARFVNIVSAPEIYTHEWASFTTLPYPENGHAHDGDIVRIITREFATGTPAEDILCSNAAYREIYRSAGLEIIADYRPLGRVEDGVAYLSETEIAPWVIYVLGAAL